MIRFALFVYFSLYTTYIFNQKNIETLHQKKYTNHNTYSEFINYLVEETGKINSEIEKITFIRKQIAEIINRGAGGNDISRQYDNWVELDGETYYELLKKKMTVMCGGSSHFTKRVFTDMGYESVTYDMGCPGKYTHQVVLCKTREDGLYYIQDAFHNASFLHKNTKKNIDFVSIISLLQNRKDKQIIVKYDQLETKFVWDTTGLYNQLASHNMTKYYKLAVNNMTNISLKKYIASSRKRLHVKNNCLIQEKLPKKYIYLYLLPLAQNSSIIKSLFEGTN